MKRSTAIGGTAAGIGATAALVAGILGTGQVTPEADVSPECVLPQAVQPWTEGYCGPECPAEGEWKAHPEGAECVAPDGAGFVLYLSEEHRQKKQRCFINRGGVEVCR